MAPLEQPHTCDICECETLINIGKAGLWNKVLHTGGPSQEPRLMGLGWAFYRCPMCEFEGPWRINYVGGSRELHIKYNELLNQCKLRHEKRNEQRELIERLYGELDAATILESLPGKDKGIEQAIEVAIVPLQAKIKELETIIAKRKGGRPPLPPEVKAKREEERKIIKREREARRRASLKKKKETE